jgi:hypothetical protein
MSLHEVIMRRRWQVALMAGVAALASGCAAMRVGSHVDRQLDFTQYRTYDWGDADALPVDDPRLASDPYFTDALEGAVEKQMAARGFERGPASDAPDLRIHYHASIDSRLIVHESGGSPTVCAGGGCGAGVEQYEAGTIVIDIVDARRDQLVWRGWTQGSVEGVLNRREQLAQRVTDAVERLFKELPATSLRRAGR